MTRLEFADYLIEAILLCQSPDQIEEPVRRGRRNLGFSHGYGCHFTLGGAGLEGVVRRAVAPALPCGLR